MGAEQGGRNLRRLDRHYPPQHSEFLRLLRNGEIAVGIEAARARALLIDGSFRYLGKEVRRHLLLPSVTVLTLWVGEPLALLGAFVASALAVGIWALPIMGILLLLWFYTRLREAQTPHRVWPELLALVAALGWAAFLWGREPWLATSLAAMPLPWVCSRCSFVIAIRSLRSLVIKNVEAYEYFWGDVLFIKVRRNAKL